MSSVATLKHKIKRKKKKNLELLQVHVLLKRKLILHFYALFRPWNPK